MVTMYFEPAKPAVLIIISHQPPQWLLEPKAAALTFGDIDPVITEGCTPLRSYGKGLAY